MSGILCGPCTFTVFGNAATAAFTMSSFPSIVAAKTSIRALCSRRNSAMSRRPMWEAPPSAVSKSPLPQSIAPLINVGSAASISLTASRLKWPAITKRFTRARSICGSCSGKSGTSFDDGLGAGELPPGWANRPRPNNAPTAAIPLPMRNFLRLTNVFMTGPYSGPVRNTSSILLFSSTARLRLIRHSRGDIAQLF